MNDRAATPDAPAEPTHEEVAEPTPLALAEDGLPLNPALEPTTCETPPEAIPPTLEDRVRQLENKMAMLEDTRKLEERVAERVVRRIERKQANIAIKAPVATIAEPSKPAAAVGVVAPREPPPIVLPESRSRRQPWLIADIFSEFRAMLRMFLDGRYRLFYMTWQTKVYPPLLIGLMVLSWLTINQIPVVGFVMDKIAELMLAFFLYKVLSREATRYRQISPQIKGAGHR
jgi:hypothetical protein